MIARSQHRPIDSRALRAPRMLAQVLSALAAVVALPQCATAMAAAGGVISEICPAGSVEVAPGASIDAASEAAGDNASICLKNGLHRLQVIRPRAGQKFYGEGQTVLNGTRLVTSFTREGRYWVASIGMRRRPAHGECAPQSPTCNMPEGVFIDDKPLVQVLSRTDVEAGQFYIDAPTGKVFLADDPTARKVEITGAVFAFASNAPNVLIRNVIVEKYANSAQSGAINAMPASGWVIENVEARWNSGAGISIGAAGRVRASNIHHNGQIGLVGEGRDIAVENNTIWANNTRGFDYTWEAGGLKIGLSNGVVMRGNVVHDNVGPGLWCDIECRNVLYEHNVVQRNRDAGIFHEISYNAVIRDNISSDNGSEDRGWFWGADILVAASQDVQVYGNTVTVRPGGCGIMLIDQGRPRPDGTQYKTRDNTVHDNEVTFEGGACAGAVSDVRPGGENYAIIPDGNNRFDGNTYRVPRSVRAPQRFPFGHSLLDWAGWQKSGLDPHGRLVDY